MLTAVGMSDAALRIFEGSLDYRVQTRCYLPPGMPESSRPDYDEAVANVAVSVLAASARSCCSRTIASCARCARRSTAGRPGRCSRRGSARAASCSDASSKRPARFDDPGYLDAFASGADGQL